MLACNFPIQKFFIKVQGIKINLIFFSRGKLKGENKMSINNVSNFYGKDYAAEFGKKWEAQINENQKQLSGMGVTVPIGQSVDKKPELTGLQVEKSDVTAEKIDRELTSDKAIKQAEKEAQKAFVEYGSEDGKKVSEKDAKKLAKNYVENEQHKEEVKGTQVFIDKKAYKAAEKERKQNYEKLYDTYREQGLTRKEAKRKANAQLADNEYIHGRKTRKFVENNRAYFYDENGNFSSDKFKQKAVEYANINTQEDETLNYHLSLKERRAAAQQEGVNAKVIKNIAKASNLDYEKDNTNLYRTAFVATTTGAGIGIGSLFHISSSAAAAAGASSSATAGAGAGAAASGAADAAASAAAAASINGAAVGGISGAAAGVGGAGFLADKGVNEKRVYAPGKPEEPAHKPKTPEHDLIPPQAPADTPAQPTPPAQIPCPEDKWESEYCDHKVKKGQNWSTVILGKVEVNGKKPQGNVLKALIHAEKIKHGVTNFKLNTMPSTMRLYTDYSDLLENAEIMKKYPELRYLKDAQITLKCNGKVASQNGRPRTHYTAFTGAAVATNRYKQSCNDNEPIRY